MGTKDLSFVQLNQLIGRKTGGISVYPLTSSVRGKAEPCSKFVVRGKSMAGRAEDLFNLVLCLLSSFYFNLSHFCCSLYMLGYRMCTSVYLIDLAFLCLQKIYFSFMLYSPVRLVLYSVATFLSLHFVFQIA